MANFRSRDVAVRVGGRVAALEPYLMRPFTIIELDEKVGVCGETTFRVYVHLSDPAVDALRVELRIPSGIERVAEVEAAPVAAQLHHLRSTGQGHSGLRMRRPADDATQMYGSRMPRAERVGDVVLAQLPGAPAGDVEELVVEGEVDVAGQGRHRTEGLQGGRQLVRVGRLCRDVDHLLDPPPAVLAVPEPYR